MPLLTTPVIEQVFFDGLAHRSLGIVITSPDQDVIDYFELGVKSNRTQNYYTIIRRMINWIEEGSTLPGRWLFELDEADFSSVQEIYYPNGLDDPNGPQPTGITLNGPDWVIIVGAVDETGNNRSAFSTPTAPVTVEPLVPAVLPPAPIITSGVYNRSKRYIAIRCHVPANGVTHTLVDADNDDAVVQVIPDQGTWSPPNECLRRLITYVFNKTTGTYHFRLRSSNTVGDSVFSNTIEVVVNDDPDTPVIGGYYNTLGDFIYVDVLTPQENVDYYTFTAVDASGVTRTNYSYFDTFAGVLKFNKPFPRKGTPGYWRFTITAHNASGSATSANCDVTVRKTLATPEIELRYFSEDDTIKGRRANELVTDHDPVALDWYLKVLVPAVDIESAGANSVAQFKKVTTTGAENFTWYTLVTRPSLGIIYEYYAIGTDDPVESSPSNEAQAMKVGVGVLTQESTIIDTLAIIGYSLILGSLGASAGGQRGTGPSSPAPLTQMPAGANTQFQGHPVPGLPTQYGQLPGGGLTSLQPILPIKPPPAP